MSKTLTKTALTAAVTTALLAGTAVTSTASAEVSANIGFTSNYLFRGVSESGDDSAVQGGLDYEHEGGFYIGTWTSSLGGGGSYELDGYFGVAGEIGDSGVGFDVGYIYYAYPADDDADFGELYGALDFMGFYGMVNFVTNADESELEDTISYELGYSHDVMPGMSLGATIGYVDWDDSDWEDYTWWSLHATKETDLGDFTFAYTQNDIDDGSNIDDPRVNVSFVMSF
ncbi:TorF family putative porin [Ectothiorhodospira haloalkaliphila]|uniref:TorF family putative porin n=1 Tax=Ectothiorhodospira haloalkaliphila TaxID=421628 RepID=UPI001EE8840C|nr:TorF family putative porin [Ectothiorhodospira haloalkaliphila]MCG5526055.1 TorF family putative porin [Ectothiorhodospira haloalkaliphila]